MATLRTIEDYRHISYTPEIRKGEGEGLDTLPLPK